MMSVLRFYVFLLGLLFLQQGTAVENYLRLATTTSTENSGLLDLLNPPFESQYNAEVHVIAVGTGKALRLAEAGDVDLVFVHAPAAERKLVEKGFGIERKPVMHNDFILLGPPDDPAGLKNADNLQVAMAKLTGNTAGFISRGDDSGTHKKERILWERAGIEPSGEWYRSVGQGMGQVLQIAHEKQAYTLSDRGTYLAYRDKINLEVVFENDPLLDNPYHIILVNPEKHPHTRIELARKYQAYVTGDEGQRIIREFRIKGEQLFYPDVIR